MIERIEENASPLRRWEALIRYRNERQEASRATGNSGEKSASSQADKQPETAVNRQGDTKNSESSGKTRSRAVIGECETCKNRRYVDVSNDGSVSFQTPTHVDPSSAGGAVLAHEGEHVSHEQADAQRDGRKVVSQKVQIHTAVCPECGRIFVSGGTTTTVTAEDKSKLSEFPEQTSHFDLRV